MIAHTSVEAAFALFCVSIMATILLTIAVYKMLAEESDIHLCLHMAELLENKSAATESDPMTAEHNALHAERERAR